MCQILILKLLLLKLTSEFIGAYLNDWQLLLCIRKNIRCAWCKFNLPNKHLITSTSFKCNNYHILEQFCILLCTLCIQLKTWINYSLNVYPFLPLSFQFYYFFACLHCLDFYISVYNELISAPITASNSNQLLLMISGLTKSVICFYYFIDLAF